MTTFQPPAIDTDVDTITTEILDGLADRLPGWTPVEGGVETALAEEFAAQSAVVAQAAVDSIVNALAGVGDSVFGLPAIQATNAQLPVYVTVTTLGDVIPAGLVVAGVNPSGVEVAFELPGDVVADELEQRVMVTAVGTGTAYNGLAGGLVVATATATVVSARVIPTDELAGPPELEPVPATDAETPAAYLARLVDYLGWLRVGGVTAEDLAAVARTVPGVYRATGLDNYDPATPEVIAERTVTLAAVDETGAKVSAGVLTAIAAAVEKVREVNFVVKTTDPTFNRIQITFNVIAERTATGPSGGGAPSSAVRSGIQQAIYAAVKTYLRRDWGLDPSKPRSWINRTSLSYFDIVQVIAAVPGVAAVTSLTLNGGTTDVALTGAIPYPKTFIGTGETSPSTISGSVT